MSASPTHRDSDIIEVPRLGHRQIEVLSDLATGRLSAWLDYRGGHYRFFLTTERRASFANFDERGRLFGLLHRGLLAAVHEVGGRVILTPFGLAATGLPEPKLFPGSAESVFRGCRCPIMDNRQGLGSLDGKYWMEESCPIHGQGVEERS